MTITEIKEVEEKIDKYNQSIQKLTEAGKGFFEEVFIVDETIEFLKAKRETLNGRLVEVEKAINNI